MPVDAVLLKLPPAVDQSISPTPLSVWSAAIFIAAAICALIIARYRPAWTLGLLVAWTPFAFYRDVGPTTITVEKALLIGTLIGLVFGGVRLTGAVDYSRPVLWAFWLPGIALFLTTVLSAVQAEHLGAVAREALKMLEYLALGWCAFAIVRTRGRPAGDALALGALVATIGASAYAVAQPVFGGAPSELLIDAHRVPRVAGPLEGPNQLAGYFEAVLPIVWLSPLLRSGWLAIVRFAAITLAFAALVLTQSRAGIAIVVVAYAALWFIDRPAARSAVASVACGAIIGLAAIVGWFAAAAGGFVSGGLALAGEVMRAPQETGGVGTRAELWRAAFSLFARHPMTGVGAGNFELSLRSVGLAFVRTHANSLWLQTLAEQGVLGFAALVAFAVGSLRVAIAGMRSSWLSRAALLATAALFAHQFVDDLFFFPKVGMTWWLVIGAASGEVVGAVHGGVDFSRPSG